MFKYEWKGIDQEHNKLINGDIYAATEDAANLELIKKNIQVLSLKKVQSSEKVSNTRKIEIKKNYGKVEKKEKVEKKVNINKSVKLKELMMYTKQFAAMTKAGLPVLETFVLLSKQVENPVLREISKLIKDDLEEGVPLSISFKKYPKVFDNIYINMLKSGESSGQMDFYLKKLTETIQKNVLLAKTVKKALFYPTMLLGVTVLVILVLFIYVVPVFADMYKGAGKALPGPTQAVINISNFVKNPSQGGLLAFVIISLISTHIFLKKNNLKYKYKFDAFLMRLPLLSELFIKSTAAKVSLLLGNLSGSGVPLTEVLEITSTSIDNLIIKDSILRVKEGINHGIKLSDLFEKEGFYPKQFEAMLKVGEESGNMDEMLINVSEYYEEEVKDVVEKMTGLLEPMMLLFIGFSIGFILVAMYMPIFSMGKTM